MIDDITSLNNPTWQDPGVSVRVILTDGRYEVCYPLISGEADIPDFITHQSATDYAQHVAKTMRFTRDVAHGTALREQARRSARTTRLDLVLRDVSGDRWVLVGKDTYLLTSTIDAGRLSAAGRNRAHIEKHYGPTVVEHCMDVRGELA